MCWVVQNTAPLCLKPKWEGQWLCQICVGTHCQPKWAGEDEGILDMDTFVKTQCTEAHDLAVAAGLTGTPGLTATDDAATSPWVGIFQALLWAVSAGDTHTLETALHDLMIRGPGEGAVQRSAVVTCCIRATEAVFKKWGVRHRSDLLMLIRGQADQKGRPATRLSKSDIKSILTVGHADWQVTTWVLDQITAHSGMDVKKVLSESL